MLTPDVLRTGFSAGRDYDSYVATGKPHEQTNWRGFHSRASLTSLHRELLGAFIRPINALCVSGTWCGDCVQQCPIFDHIARAAAGRIDLRFVDRDSQPTLADHLHICGGNRVPVLVLCNEDFDFVALAGDRSLSRYRGLATRLLGAACPLPGAPVPEDEIAATVQDWVNEFERVHLLLRLSPKLRGRYQD